jgi:hypothetical protein
MKNTYLSTLLAKSGLTPSSRKWEERYEKEAQYKTSASKGTRTFARKKLTSNTFFNCDAI